MQLAALVGGASTFECDKAYWKLAVIVGGCIADRQGQLFRRIANNVMNFAQFSDCQASLCNVLRKGILHVMYLGVTTCVLGNVLWEALDNTGFTHTTKEGRCAFALADVAILRAQ